MLFSGPQQAQLLLLQSVCSCMACKRCVIANKHCVIPYKHCVNVNKECRIVYKHCNITHKHSHIANREYRIVNKESGNAYKRYALFLTFNVCDIMVNSYLLKLSNSIYCSVFHGVFYTGVHVFVSAVTH